MAKQKDYANNRDLTLSVNTNAPPIDKNDRVIGQTLRVINEWEVPLQTKLDENDKIDETLEDTMTVVDRSRNAPMPSYLLQSVRFKTKRGLQPPDWMLQATGVSNEELSLLTEATKQKMVEGNWNDFMTGKWGIIDKVVTYGDGVGRVSSFSNRENLTEKEREKIINFQNTAISKLYWGAFTTELLNPGGEGEADEVVAVYTYPWEKAIQYYPMIEELSDVGKLPDTIDGYNEDDMTPEQRTFAEARKIEIAFYYNKREKVYSMIAGRNAAKIFEHKDDMYPFVFFDGEAYLPFLHFYCYEGIEGFYNTGICGLFYSIDRVWTELLNRATAYIMDNVDPVQIINLPAGKRQEFYEQIEDAQDAQEVGARPWIVNELSVDEAINMGQIQNVQTKALTGEFERLITQLKGLSDMIGVKLDELMSAPGKPLGTTELELENRDENKKAIVDNWTPTIQFAVKLTMDAIRRDVDPDDEELIDGEVEVAEEDENGDIVRDELGTPKMNKVENVMMGDAKRLLDDLAERGIRVNVIVNSASGIVKSNNLEIAQITNELNSGLTLPGTLHYKYLQRRLSELRGFTINENSFSNPQAQQAQIDAIGGAQGNPAQGQGAGPTPNSGA